MTGGVQRRSDAGVSRLLTKPGVFNPLNGRFARMETAKNDFSETTPHGCDTNLCQTNDCQSIGRCQMTAVIALQISQPGGELGMATRLPFGARESLQVQPVNGVSGDQRDTVSSLGAMSSNYVYSRVLRALFLRVALPSLWYKCLDENQRVVSLRRPCARLAVSRAVKSSLKAGFRYI